MYMTEKILFWGQIFDIEILMNLQVLMHPESENPILSGCFVCMCVFAISLTQKQIIAEIPNWAFYICIINRFCLNLFMKMEDIIFANMITSTEYIN